MYSSFAGMATTYILTIILILYLVETREKPWKLFFNFFRHLFTNYRFAVILALMLGVLLLNKYELAFENTYKFPNYDLTGLVYSLEGNFSVYIQRLENTPLTQILSYFYVFVFPALVWVSLIYYKYKNDDTAVRRTFIAFIMNYIIAIPFYLFVPVNETWYGNPQVHLLISNVYPAFNTEYRALSGLNNDFPSLHTSISWSLAFVAMSLGYKRFARILTCCAALITFSTLYLGIHWATDVVGGLTLASIVVFIASRLSMREFIPQLQMGRIKKRIATAKQYLLDVTTNLFS